MKQVLLLLLLAVVACGGKIAPDPDEHFERPVPSASSVLPRPSPSPSAAHATPSYSAAESCQTVCQHASMCGAYQADCEEECVAEHRSACGPDVAAFFSCWASTLSSCLALHPSCEQTYCAYARCTGRVGEQYCR